MSGFLPAPVVDLPIAELVVRFRSLSRYGWFPTEVVSDVTEDVVVFPSPLEVWVVSYLRLLP